MLSHTVMLWSVTEIEFEFFCGIFSTFKCSYFCFCMCWPLGANTWMWDICIRVTSAVCNSILSHWNLPIIRQQRQLRYRMAHMQTVAPKGQHMLWSKESILIYLTIWVLRLVCVCQVFSEEIKSNAVSKLFILIWRDESNKFRSY